MDVDAARKLIEKATDIVNKRDALGPGMTARVTSTLSEALDALMVLQAENGALTRRAIHAEADAGVKQAERDVAIWHRGAAEQEAARLRERAAETEARLRKTEGHLALANKNTKRRGERVAKLEAELSELCNYGGPARTWREWNIAIEHARVVVEEGLVGTEPDEIARRALAGPIDSDPVVSEPQEHP